MLCVDPLHAKRPNPDIFWTKFPRIYTEYGDLQSQSLSTDQKNQENKD